MTSAKIMDVIARLPGCDGQAADAVSAYTRVKLVDTPRLLKSPKSECPDIWIRLPRHKWPKSWVQYRRSQSFLLSEICMVIPWQDCLWERQFGEALFELGWEKTPIWECMFVHRETRVISVRKCGCHQNMAPMWKKLHEECAPMWKNPHDFLNSRDTWTNPLSVNANQMKQSLNSIQRCLSHVFLLEQQNK